MTEAHQGNGHDAAVGGHPVTNREREREDIENAGIAAIMENDGEGGENGHPGQKRHSRKKKRDRDFIDLLLLLAVIENAIARVQAIIDFHEEQMEQIARHIMEAQEILDGLKMQEESLRDVLEKFRENGAFELDENGALKNKIAEKALRAWERKTGRPIDRTDPGSYLLVLEVLADIEAEEGEIETGIKADQEDYEHHKAERDKALEIREALESSDPERRRQGMERMNELGFHQGIETAKNIAEADLNRETRAQGMERAGLIEKDLAQDAFAFKFPPLRSDFDKSVIGNAEPEAETVIEAGLKQKSPGIMPR